MLLKMTLITQDLSELHSDALHHPSKTKSFKPYKCSSLRNYEIVEAWDQLEVKFKLGNKFNQANQKKCDNL